MTVTFEINLTKKQKEIYEAVHSPEISEIVAVMSRQTGKTTIASILIVEHLFTVKKASVFYISPTYKQGRKVFKDVADLLSQTTFIKKKNSSELTIELKNGSILKFFTAKNASAIRGQTAKGLVVIDEASFIPEQTADGQLTWQAIIKPVCKVHKPKVLLISTPNGKSGFFYDEYLRGISENNKQVKTIVATIYDDELITKEEIEELKESTPPMAWRQEFMVEFLDSALTVFNGFERQFKETTEKPKGKIWIGVDLSSTEDGDMTVITAIDGDNNNEQYIIEGDLDSKYNKIAKVIDSYQNVQGVYIEANGIGEPMINEIKKLVTKNKSKLRYWTTTNKNKSEMVGQLSLEITKGDIWFNKNTQTQLYSQFGTYSYKINKNTRNITYNARDGFHDDCIMSLMMALRAKEDIKGFDSRENLKIVQGRRIRKIG